VQQPGGTGTIGKFEYEQVAPNEEFTQALAKAIVVDVPQQPSDRKTGSGAPKMFNPDSIPNGAGAAPASAQVFMPGTAGAAPPPHQKHGTARGAAPEAPDPLNRTVVFVPDEGAGAEPEMPPPPTILPPGRGGSFIRKSVGPYLDDKQ
jgi:hypothetical protein